MKIKNYVLKKDLDLETERFIVKKGTLVSMQENKTNTTLKFQGITKSFVFEQEHLDKIIDSLERINAEFIIGDHVIVDGKKCVIIIMEENNFLRVIIYYVEFEDKKIKICLEDEITKS